MVQRLPPAFLAPEPVCFQPPQGAPHRFMYMPLPAAFAALAEPAPGKTRRHLHSAVDVGLRPGRHLARVLTVGRTN